MEGKQQRKTSTETQLIKLLSRIIQRGRSQRDMTRNHSNAVCLVNENSENKYSVEKESDEIETIGELRMY